MQIKENINVMIFSHEYKGKKFYSIGLSKKDNNNKFINGYINCNFKKGVDIDNKTIIKIKKGWVDFYLKDKITVPYVFILDFEIVESNNIQSDPYDDMGKQIEIEDDMYPF